MKLSLRAVHIPQALLTFAAIFFSTMAVMPQFKQYQTLLIIVAGALAPAAAGAASVTRSIVSNEPAPSERPTPPDPFKNVIRPPPPGAV
jgi:hypothetical protein